MARTECLTVREVAQAKGCTINYVFQLLWAGRLKGATKVDGRWEIPASAIEEREGSRTLEEAVA